MEIADEVEVCTMIFSYERGHRIIYTGTLWIYEDTQKIAKGKRRCKRCGKKPTKEGHDACLGKLENIEHACCGHGVHESYKI